MPRPCVQITAVSCSSDATNSNIWHKSKLHTTEVSAEFLANTSELQHGDLTDVMPRNIIVADVQRVASGKQDHPQHCRSDRLANWRLFTARVIR